VALDDAKRFGIGAILLKRAAELRGSLLRCECVLGSIDLGPGIFHIQGCFHFTTKTDDVRRENANA
jgi:hypothetical protein